MKERTVFAGSIVAALFASACCLGPIVLVGLGATATAFAAKFAVLRPYLLGLTGLLLAIAFYLVYRKPAVACEGEVCALPRSRRWTRWSLWLVTVTVIALALFPVYYGKIATARHSTVPPAGRAPMATIELKISGMTCEACAGIVSQALQKAPGVQSAQVDFPAGRAIVNYDPTKVTPDKLVEAIKASGYQALLPNPRQGD